MATPERLPPAQVGMAPASKLAAKPAKDAPRAARSSTGSSPGASEQASGLAPAGEDAPLAEAGGHASVVDAERVKRALAGDSSAFEELYKAYRPAVFKVAHGVTGNVEDALDVTQETFLKAHRSLELFEGRASVLTWLCQIAIHRAIDLGRRKKVRRAVELEDFMTPARAGHRARTPIETGAPRGGETGASTTDSDKARTDAGAGGNGVEGWAEQKPHVSRLPDRMGPSQEHDPAVLAAGNELKTALSKALAELSDKHREVFLLYTVKGLAYREIADSLGVSIGTVMSRLFYARKNLQGLLAEFAN